MTQPSHYAAMILAATLTLLPFSLSAQEAAMLDAATQNYIDRFESLIDAPDHAKAIALALPAMVDHAPWPGHTPDLAGFEAGLAEMRLSFPDLSAEVLRIVAQGDLLAVHFKMSGTQLGPFMGAPATGKTFAIEAMDIVRLQDGRIAEHWGVMDAAAMAARLGL